MGLIVSESHVSVDHSINDWLITTLEGNPTIEVTSSLKVYSIFKRLKSSRKSRRNRKEPQLGDNCPIIYALKGKDGLTTDITSVKKLVTSFNQIISKIYEQEPNRFELVVSIPSSYNISYILGSRVARMFQCNHSADFFKKIDIKDAFNILKYANITPSEKRKIYFRIQKMEKEVGINGNFSLKEIPTKYRLHFRPLIINKDCKLAFIPSRVLIVDDLFATGTTLETAKLVINKEYPETMTQAICLFSSIN